MANGFVKKNYCWIIMIACCLVFGIEAGINNNCIGLYYLPVSQDLGCPVGSVTLYVTIRGAVQSFLILFVFRKVILTVPVKRVLTFSGLCQGIPLLIMARAKSIGIWYLCAAIQGFNICTFAVPVVLERWFHKRLGFVFGITTAFTGISGLILSMVFGRIIRMWSWRVSMTVSGIVMTAVTVPLALFVIRLNPFEKNLIPYGSPPEDYEKEQKIFRTGEVVSVKVPFDKRLVLIVLSGMLIACLTSFGSHLSSMGKAMNISIVEASLLITINMAGNVSAKIIFGTLDDKIGLKKCTMIIMGIITCGIVLMMTGNQVAMLVSVFAFGFNGMISASQLPVISRSVWSSAEYASGFRLVMFGRDMMYAVMAMVYGVLYDCFGSYKPIIPILLAVSVLNTITFYILLSIGGKTDVADSHRK